MDYLSRLHLGARLLILFLIVVGLLLAFHKPLWNDETYSLLASIEDLSAGDIISGKAREGNNAPLFYLLQKGVIALFRYQSPVLWREGSRYWSVNRPEDKIILRIVPIVCMALSITAIFYYFARFYSLWAGGLAIFLSLTTSAVWQYWVEARHYPLWFFLTTLQFLFFLHMCRFKAGQKIWNGLIIIHLLLSLTVIFSLGQIVIVSGLLYVFTERRISKYILLTLCPVIFCLLFYALAPKYDFWLMFTYEQYIRAGISRDRLYVSYLFILFLIAYSVQRRTKAREFLRQDVLEKGVPFLLLTGGMAASVCLIVWAFQHGACPPSKGFPVTTRYFINLAPAGIIATTLFAVLITRACFRLTLLRVILFAGMGCLFMHRVFKIWPDIQGHYPLLFF